MTNILNRKLLAGLFLFAFTTFLIASFYIHEVRSDYVMQIRLKVAKQETQLAMIADLTSKDGADAVVDEIIKDCSSENRNRFDTLLSKLGTLRKAELDETKQLFDACANYFAERKAVMVARLEREYEVYLDFIDLLPTEEKKSTTITYYATWWGNRVLLEKEVSTLSTHLVSVQGQIIEALMNNKPITSDEMQLLLVEGQETKEKLTALSVQINNLRQEVLNL